MALIKCSKCGKEIFDEASACIDCGAPVVMAATDVPPQATSSVIGDLNGDGKVDFEDFKLALSRSKQFAADQVDAAVKLGKKKLQSAKEKDAAAVEELAQEFGKTPLPEQSESLINRDKFKAALESTIDVKFADIMRSKKDLEVFLTYIDAQIMTASVRNIFKSVLTVTPPQVDAACMLSEAVLAPTTVEKEKQIKAAVGIAGGTAGIGIVIGAIGSALGWGAGVITTFSAAVVGSSFAGPLGWGIAGLSLAVVAGYFASTSNKQTDTERFLRVLKSSTARAVDAIWEQYEKELSKIIALAASADSGNTK